MFTDFFMHLEKVELRKEDPRFYFVWHKRLFNSLIGLMLGAVIVWFGAAYLAFTRPEAVTWAQTAEGKTVPLYSVEEPQYSMQAVEEWTETAIKTAYNYDFDRYDQQIMMAQPYFAPDAWELFKKNITTVVLPKLKEKRLLVSVAVGKAQIGSNPIVIGGFMTWQVKVPAMISYVSGSESESQKVEFQVIVRRQVVYTNPKGLWISQLIENRL